MGSKKLNEQNVFDITRPLIWYKKKASAPNLGTQWLWSISFRALYWEIFYRSKNVDHTVIKHLTVHKYGVIMRYIIRGFKGSEV